MSDLGTVFSTHWAPNNAPSHPVATPCPPNVCSVRTARPYECERVRTASTALLFQPHPQSSRQPRGAHVKLASAAGCQAQSDWSGWCSATSRAEACLLQKNTAVSHQEQRYSPFMIKDLTANFCFMRFVKRLNFGEARPRDRGCERLAAHRRAQDR